MIRKFRTRRWISIAILLLIVAIVLVFIGRPIFYLLGVALNDRDERRPLPPGMVDDASRLNATHIAEIWNMPSSNDAEQQLRDLLLRAAREHLCISPAGSRHSMGGQTLYPNGIQINMLPYHRMKLDEQRNLLEVQTGATWAEVVPFLDQHHRSVAVMQSNNTFSVGGSLSVNCHGWQPGRPPIASTVESFRLMKADGNIVVCSRTQNAQLFSLALGGYGLFGIILDAQLRVVPNERYELHQFMMPTSQFSSAWQTYVMQPSGVGMALGRLSVVPDDFLNEAIIYTFTPAALPSGELPQLTPLGFEALARILFRGSAGSNYGKALRWEAETEIPKHFAKRFISRNQLQNEPVDMLANRTADSTDILHEYFVPRSALEDFLAHMRIIIPKYKGNLLNVTLRDVRRDPDTFLRYANRDMIALVLLFNQRLTVADTLQMQLLTRQLIDAALTDGGCYYLPYRLDATPEQFEQAYPQAKQFFELKRQFDPGELFQNEMYIKYQMAGARPATKPVETP